MQAVNIRNKFDLRWGKSFLIVFFILGASTTNAQRITDKNLPYYDDQLIHYGFSIGIHSSTFRVEHSPSFAGMDSLHSVMPGNSIGFSLGVIGNLRLAQYLDLRFLPEVAFYENQVDFNLIRDNTPELDRQTVQNTYVEFPLLFKYKSRRRKNTRMYVIGGIEPAIEVTGTKDENRDENQLLVGRSNFSVLFGLGLDYYFPLFKFSPEMRYSMGLNNVLSEEESPYADGIDRLTTHTVTLYLLFE
jgi:hypothetical protein